MTLVEAVSVLVMFFAACTLAAFLGDWLAGPTGMLCGVLAVPAALALYVWSLGRNPRLGARKAPADRDM